MMEKVLMGDNYNGDKAIIIMPESQVIDTEEEVSHSPYHQTKSQAKRF